MVSAEIGSVMGVQDYDSVGERRQYEKNLDVEPQSVESQSVKLSRGTEILSVESQSSTWGWVGKDHRTVQAMGNWGGHVSIYSLRTFSEEQRMHNNEN
jgi:hypothetical protein